MECGDEIISGLLFATNNVVKSDIMQIHKKKAERCEVVYYIGGW